MTNAAASSWTGTNHAFASSGEMSLRGGSVQPSVACAEIPMNRARTNAAAFMSISTYLIENVKAVRTGNGSCRAPTIAVPSALKRIRLPSMSVEL